MLGGGAGSILHMITTLKNNKMLLKRVNRYKKEHHNNVRHTKHYELEFKHATKEELEAFRIVLKKRIRIQQFKNGLALAFSILLTAIIVLFIYKNFFIE